MTNLEPFQTRASRNFTVTSENVLNFDFVVFASSYCFVSILSWATMEMSSLNLPYKSMENALMTSRKETPGFDKLCKRSIG